MIVSKTLKEKKEKGDLIKSEEILGMRLITYHNLYFLNNMLKEIRQAIDEDRFEQYRKDFLERFHSGVK